jgi:hypothetical protein
MTEELDRLLTITDLSEMLSVPVDTCTGRGTAMRAASAPGGPRFWPTFDTHGVAMVAPKPSTWSSKKSVDGPTGTKTLIIVATNLLAADDDGPTAFDKTRLKSE